MVVIGTGEGQLSLGWVAVGRFFEWGLGRRERMVRFCLDVKSCQFGVERCFVGTHISNSNSNDRLGQ